MIRDCQLILFASLLVLTLSSMKQNVPLVATFVTGWWPLQDGIDLPVGDNLTVFQLLVNLPFNMIFLGQPQFGKLVASKRSGNNTMFVEILANQLTTSWYYTKAQQLKQKGQSIRMGDKVNPILMYSRLFLLNKAGQNDPFQSDQLFWMDFNALAFDNIETIASSKNVNSLLQGFKHHFFMLTTPKNAGHEFSKAQKTYFNISFDTFVTSQLIGSKKEALSTISLIYEDLLRVILQFDANLWTEDAILSLLVDRCPFLISFLSADGIKLSVPTNRLLPQITQQRFEIEKKELEGYEWWISMTEIVIIGIGLLLAWQIIRFLHFVKTSSHRVLKNDAEIDVHSISGSE